MGAAREAVREQLAPLEELGGTKAEAAIQTLRVYLDEHCSIARTAAVLHLHRNAVTYRLQRISELAGIDLDDPDQRLALQLACRARLLALPPAVRPGAHSGVAAARTSVPFGPKMIVTGVPGIRPNRSLRCRPAPRAVEPQVAD